MLHRHRDDQSTSSRDGMAKLSTDPTVGGEGKQAMATAPTTSASASTVVSRTDGGRNGGSTEIETCRRCREDDKTGGCSRKALEARCAAESTARIAAEERAERAERTVNELKKVVLRAGRAQGGVVAECGAVDAAQLRIRRLEAHLGEARAGASKAEEMLKKKREACGKTRLDNTGTLQVNIIYEYLWNTTSKMYTNRKYRKGELGGCQGGRGEGMGVCAVFINAKSSVGVFFHTYSVTVRVLLEYSERGPPRKLFRMTYNQ